MKGEIKLFDKNFTPIGILDRYESLIVHKKMTEAGSFELHTPVLLRAAYWYNAELDAFGIFDRFSTSAKLYAGTLLKGLLDRKAIRTDATYTDLTAEQLAYRLAEEYAPIPMLYSAPSMDLAPVTASVSWGDPVGESISAILAAHELYYDITFDFAAMLPVFTVHAVIKPQNAMPLSYAYQTIHDFDYTEDKSDYKNMALVRGAYGEETVEITVDLRDDENETAHEVALDLSNEVESEGLTAAQYEQALHQKATEKLSEYPIVRSIQFTPAVEMRLGERRIFEDATLGISAEQVVTETVDAIEGGCVKRSYLFGWQKLTPYRRAVRDARRK